MKTLVTTALVILLIGSDAMAGVPETVKAVAKASLQGSLVKTVTIKGTTATITYGSTSPNDWGGTSRERAASRVIPKVFQQVPSIKKVIVVIEQNFKAVMSRSEAEAFYGAFQSDADFKKNVSDGVTYDKVRLSNWAKKFVVMTR